jgi:hypothetical protein
MPHVWIAEMERSDIRPQLLEEAGRVDAKAFEERVRIGGVRSTSRRPNISDASSRAAQAVWIERGIDARRACECGGTDATSHVPARPFAPPAAARSSVA